MMLKEESKKQLITRATQYGVDPFESRSAGGGEGGTGVRSRWMI